MESEFAYGQFNGCFEKPSMTKDPTDNIDCPDIAPLTFSNNVTNRDAMKNPSRLVHPDSDSRVKYCMGTGLQMRKGRSSHKMKSCEYHNVNLSKQGKFIRTMTQEAMQVAMTSHTQFHPPTVYSLILFEQLREGRLQTKVVFKRR